MPRHRARNVENRFATVLLLGFLVLMTVGVIFLDPVPTPVPSSAPPEQFSAGRAMAYVSDFAQKPHPTGTPEHDRVRDYLLAQIASLFVTPEVQRTTGVTPLYQVAGRIENIVVRLRGTNESSDAVLLAAHYDSVAAGPGAADDGSGVATLLETLRNLTSSQPLRNDIILLFTDGEEDGMLGASAFAKEHPWAKDVRVAINFEARGTSGETQLFETSQGNGRLIQVFAQALSHPQGSSLSYEIYKRMPNDTDMTVFKKTSAGLNFAFIGNWEGYHTPLDNAARLDPGSLQQDGDYALALARGFGNADLTQLADLDSVYFSIPGTWFAHYSSAAIWILNIFAAVTFLIFAVYAYISFRVGLSSIFLALLASMEILVGLAVGAFVFVEVVDWLNLHVLPEGDIVRSVPYALSLIAFLAALNASLYKLLRRSFSWFEALLGNLALLLVATVVSSVFLPGGTYIFLWPFLSALAASLFVARHRTAPTEFEAEALCLLSSPALLLFVPLLRDFDQALGLSTLGAVLLGVSLGIFFVALTPMMEVLFTVGRAWFTVSACVIAFLVFVFAAWSTRYTEAHPKPSMLNYALDANSGKAVWASSAARPDAWTAQFVGSSPASGKLDGFLPSWLPFEFLLHDAPPLSLDGPRADLLKSSATRDSRTLLLRLNSPRHARALSVETPETEILEGWVDGRLLRGPYESRWNKNGNWGFEYVNLPAQGVDLTLHAKGTKQIKLVVVDRSLGLPTIPDTNFAPRPADSMPQHSGDETLVRRTFIF
jgi:hypothetical protein